MQSQIFHNFVENNKTAKSLRVNYFVYQFLFEETTSYLPLFWQPRFIEDLLNFFQYGVSSVVYCRQILEKDFVLSYFHVGYWSRMSDKE